MQFLCSVERRFSVPACFHEGAARSGGQHQPKAAAPGAPVGFAWITSPRAPAIQAFAADKGPLQMSLFDEGDMAGIASPTIPTGFHTLMADLGTLCLNEVVAAVNPNTLLMMTTRPTAIQQRALEFLGALLTAA